eukprot:SAG22_NODE_2866_length_2142_cov_11.708272_1_plen_236_part_00
MATAGGAMTDEQRAIKQIEGFKAYKNKDLDPEVWGMLDGELNAVRDGMLSAQEAFEAAPDMHKFTQDYLSRHGAVRDGRGVTPWRAQLTVDGALVQQTGFATQEAAYTWYLTQLDTHGITEPQNTSDYRGVDLYEGKYRARIMINGKSTYVGTFATDLEAARALRQHVRDRKQKEDDKEKAAAALKIQAVQRGKMARKQAQAQAQAQVPAAAEPEPNLRDQLRRVTPSVPMAGAQ